jgi:two-component system, response regulator PdtaR
MKPSLRVVVAEDEALIRLDLVEMLTEAGYEVVGQAGDGETAILITEKEKPDLVVMDVKMPKLDGISAAERIANQRIAPVVILTAFSQRDLVERARDAGAMAYLTKPFTIEDLMPAIELAVSRFQEIKQLDAEVSDLQEQLKARKLIEKAKGILMKNLKISEPEAFKWMQKTAMDKRRSMTDVAQLVMDEFEKN